MINYVNINKALTFIPVQVRNEENKTQLLSFILDGYRQLLHPLQSKNKIELLEIKDHKVQLPNEMKYLNMVFYTAGKSNVNIDLATTDTDPDVETTTTTTNADGSVTTVTTKEFNDRYLLSHRLMLHENYYETDYFNNFYPLAYRQGGFSYSDCCLNKHIECVDTFTVDENKVLWSSLQEGFICIDYESDIINDDGDYMIIEHPVIMRYLSYYAQQKHLENRLYGKEQGIGNILGRIDNNVNIWYRKANGIVNKLGINRALQGQITNVSYNAKILTYLSDSHRMKYETR